MVSFWCATATIQHISILSPHLDLCCHSTPDGGVSPWPWLVLAPWPRTRCLDLSSKIRPSPQSMIWPCARYAGRTCSQRSQVQHARCGFVRDLLSVTTLGAQTASLCVQHDITARTSTDEDVPRKHASNQIPSGSRIHGGCHGEKAFALDASRCARLLAVMQDCSSS
jgi:hypothetical protein